MILCKLIGYNAETDTYINPQTGLKENLPSPNFILSENIPTNYEDASTLNYWDRFGFNFGDFNFVRDNINEIVLSIVGQNFQNWNNLSLNEKKIACKYVVAPYPLRVPDVVSEQEDKINWTYLLSETKRSRAECGEKMRVAVGDKIRNGQLSLQQTQDFFKDVSEYLYWFVEANVPDFKNWIFGLPPYENVFASKNYYSVQLQDELISIYNGN